MRDREPPRKKPSYWIVLLPIVLGAATCGGSLAMMAKKVEGMTRVAVPGEHRVQLDAGSYIGFLEAQSEVDGQVIAGNVSVRCGMADASGTPLKLERPSTETTYSFGGFAGKSMLEVTIPSAGEYLVACQGEGSGALAFGSGVGSLIVLAVAAGFGGVVLAFIVLWRVRKKRKAIDAEQKVIPTAQIVR